jgi:hypothetical protein
LQESLGATQVEFENSSNRQKALEKQNATLKRELRVALQNAKNGNVAMGRSQSINSIDSVGENQTGSGTGSTSGNPPSSPLRTTGSGVGPVISGFSNSPNQSPKFMRPGSRTGSNRIETGNGLGGMEKNEIIQKLVQVQKQYVKRNEKIDFLSDHVTQLTEELKKKTKLIQSFCLREQHGRIKPPGMTHHVMTHSTYDSSF